MSSTGSMKPRPRRWPHIRLTNAFAKYGFCLAVIHAASALRVPSPFARSVPSSAVGFAFTIGWSSAFRTKRGGGPA